MFTFIYSCVEINTHFNQRLIYNQWLPIASGKLRFIASDCPPGTSIVAPFSHTISERIEQFVCTYKAHVTFDTQHTSNEALVHQDCVCLASSFRMDRHKLTQLVGKLVSSSPCPKWMHYKWMNDLNQGWDRIDIPEVSLIPGAVHISHFVFQLLVELVIDVQVIRLHWCVNTSRNDDRCTSSFCVSRYGSGGFLSS